MPCAIFMAVSALNLPVLAIIFAWCITLGRLAYSIGYFNFGPKGRLAGGIVMELAAFLCPFLAIVSIFMPVKDASTEAATVRVVPFA